MRHRVLIIGGTGVFGKRLTRHLTEFPEVDVYVSSRSLDKAAGFTKSLKAPHLHPVELDHHKNLQARLAEIKPFAVIDCSGPFQTAQYDTACAVLQAGAHFIDLADARDYLAGFADALDGVAKAQNVAALTGASSTPTLSACVVAEVTEGWQRVDTIDICITPGGKSEVGRSVIEAILSYAGKPVPIWRDGQLDTVTGWGKGQRVQIPHLGHRRVAPVETYDAEYLGPRHAVANRVSFAAGLESRVEQLGIEALANLRKRRLCPDPAFLIPTLLKARRITRIPTSDKGGMLVACAGIDAAGQKVAKQWSLIAENDHGPYIPILPAAAALQKLLRNEVRSGAALADNALGLDDILAQMEPYDISTALV